MKVVLACDLGEEFVNDLRGTFPEVDFRPAYTIADQLRDVPDAEVQFGLITREVFLAAKQLRWFHYIGMGLNSVVGDNPEFAGSDVVMTRSIGTHVIPMADHVFAMILAFSRKIPELIDDQRAHRWEGSKYFRRMRELAGNTLGMVGLGDIGRAVAQRARGFDMEVYAVDIRHMSPPAGVREVWGIERLDDLLARSDWLVVTAPLTDKTRGMIDHRFMERIKPGAFIIVISRGGIVDEAALIDALRSGRVAGAGLDAFVQEPLPPDSPLWDMPNVLLSPHASANSPQLWERRKALFKENLRRYLVGEPLLNVCDKKVDF